MAGLRYVIPAIARCSACGSREFATDEGLRYCKACGTVLEEVYG
ncbi:MAG: TFIIB-type zinc finger domain-containing protein [Candidatus Aenigmarchaeota archaeon]|nr:TFIIB-type zinc finger domain-containing protein [Candidatus Aenigmarchaeota archaeon]